jgi:hypothetical protein
MSHAMVHAAGIGAHGLWSISRGLARGLESRGDYKRMMDHADTPRQGDLDGRGKLSQRALVEFTLWFLRVCLDQVTFMSSLFNLDTLARRLRGYVERDEKLKPESARLLEEALIRGTFKRGEVSRIAGLPERTARRVLNDLIATGLLASDMPKGPVSLRFPADAQKCCFRGFSRRRDPIAAAFSMARKPYSNAGRASLDLMLKVAWGESAKSESFDFGGAEFAQWVLGATM